MTRFLRLPQITAAVLLLASAAGITLLVPGADARPVGDVLETSLNARTARLAPVNLSPPTVVGSAAAGSTLTETPGSWSGTGVTLRVEWQRCTSLGGSCVAVRGATAGTYPLATADVGSKIRVLVTASNRYGSQRVASAPTGVVAPAPAPAPAPTPPPPPAPATPPSPTGAPAVSGTAQVGLTLSASEGTWSGTAPMTYAYGWQRCDASGAACAAVAGAQSASYQPVAADVGHTLRAVVSAANAAGTASSTSQPTSAVADAPAPAPMPSSGLAIGLNGYPYGDTPEKQRLLDAGVKLIRTDRYDYGISWAHQHGITVDGIIWMKSDSAGVAADVVELDNEPYYNNWNGLGGIDQWARAARDVAKAVKAAYPSKPVLLPSLAVTNNGDITKNGAWTPMLTAIDAAAPDIWQYVDGIALHPYTRPDGPGAILANLDRLRSQLRAIGGRAATLPFWITEIGWTNTGDVAVPESTAAAYMQQLLTGLKARSDVAAVIAYTTSDGDTTKGTTDPEAGYGMYRFDGSAKPVLSVLESAAG